MKGMLKNPPEITFLTPPSFFLLDDRVFPSLGILKVAAVLEQRGIPVEHLDLNGVENYLEVVALHFQKNKVKQAGITVTTPQLPSTAHIVRTIRRVSPHTKVILGGPHITLTSAAMKLEARKGIANGRATAGWNELLKLGDVLVAGDGELAVLEAIKDSAPAFIDGDDPQGGLFLTNKTYDETPAPARHLVDMSSYKYEIEGHKSTSLIAQLGCPFGCGFCGGRNSKSLRTVRMRSTASVLAEVEHLYRAYGYTGFMFNDDELNVNMNMLSLMIGLRDLQDRLGIEFRFRGFVKSQLFTKEQAHAMYSAGFRRILIGFESGSPRILENINKRATVEDNDRAMDAAREAGLKVKALMSVGHPGESQQTVEATQKWLRKWRPEEFDCTLITTYPGTPYYDEAVPCETQARTWVYTHPKTKDRLYSRELDYFSVADYYKGNPRGGYRSYVHTDYLSAKDLEDLRFWVEDSIRTEFAIPYPNPAPHLRYEHSMGQGIHVFPEFILKNDSYLKSLQTCATSAE